MAITPRALPAHGIFFNRFEDNLNGFHNMKENSCAIEGHHRYWSTKFLQNSHFCYFEPWFLDIRKQNFWIHILLVIFKTDLPCHIDKLFLNEYLRSNTALKMQSDFTCIFLPKMDQSLRAKISWTIKNFQKIFYHHPTFMVWHNISENEGLLRTSLPDLTWIYLIFSENSS